tara:strand:- start:2145 stop:2963 length:819 start_codon:yes stop_codon:yes gene_type:complete
MVNKNNNVIPLLKYRSIFISDIHLGSKGCQAEQLLEFLKNTRSDYLYLVGDIIDGWRLKNRWYWPQSHSDVIQKILRKARHGTKVLYLAGNHDELVRKFLPITLGDIRVVNEIKHRTVDGSEYLVLHGDKFDSIINIAPWLAHLGASAYDFALWLNRRFNQLRLLLGLKYWSLSKYLKLKVKNAVSYINKYEEIVAGYAKKKDLKGVICGHIHHASHRMINGVHYYNDGDWVENCSFMVENFDGSMEILFWKDIVEKYEVIDKHKDTVKVLS